MGNLSVIFYLLKNMFMFKRHWIKSNRRDLKKIKVNTYGVPDFVPDYSATVSVTKICTNSNEYSMFFLDMFE